MANNCLDSTLAPSSGTSQAQRALAALAAGYAQVDERKTADLILLSKRYAAYLNYYNLTNAAAGDWTPFMSGDISVAIASLMAWQGSDYLPYLQELYDSIRKPAPPYADPLKTFKYVFDFAFSLALALNQTLAQVPTDEAYSDYLTVSIASRLSAPLFQLQNVYQALPAALLPATPVGADPLSPFEGTTPIALPGTGFTTQFAFLQNAPWTPPAGSFFPPVSLLLGPTADAMLANNLFTGSINAVVNGVIGIIAGTGAYLDQTLANYPSHAPHYALYLSFLRLFRTAQDHLNKYTGRHLSFYYKKVLQLKPQPAIPDTAHLVFTLQKGTNLHPLAKGLSFKAGKDANNQDRFYTLTDAVVLNQATVQDQRSLFLRKVAAAGTPPTNQQTLFALPQANTADGQGAKLTTPDQSWYAFGDPAVISEPGFATASLGLAIASHTLFLNEGVRTITLQFAATSLGSFPTSLRSGIFTAQFTGDKKWFDAADFPATTPNVTTHGETTGSSYTLEVDISLSGDAPPIVPYSAKIHGGSYPQALPMVRLQLADYTWYEALKSIRITGITVKTDVTGVQNLVLQNGDGKIDPSKPFKPFGDFPDQNAIFAIGSKEVFQKTLTALTVNLAWAGIDTTTGLPISGTTANITALRAGQWNLGLGTGADITGGSIAIPSPTSIPQAAADFSANAAYTVAAINGFIRLELQSANYGLAAFTTKIKNGLPVNPTVTINYPSGSTTPSGYSIPTPTLPPQPDILVATGTNLDYIAQEGIDLDTGTAAAYNSRSAYFYHLEPFGFREMHPFLFDSLDAADLLLPDNTLQLLPNFHLDDGLYDATDNGGAASPDNGGELWIGLANPTAGTVQQLLFQVAEGSSNPLKPVTKVNWYYMSANNWIGFGDTVGDQTNDLSQSGLVVLNLPGNETFTNTRADTGLLWVKAVVQSNPDAICRLIAVLANAAKAGGVGAVDAGTISKPAVPDAALKKTNQPYSSFGGKPPETGSQFNLRVSERLRHKHRAVTAWDYERLVLQNFPQIHKVKCLNHTRVVESTQDYSEVKPGHVMVVTVPDLSLVTGANPLLPFTSVGLLTDIQLYLQPLTSPLVCLQVKNPQFEAVRFTFDVDFINDNANSAFYRLQLDSEIQKFLMPWAFGAAADIEFGGKIEKSVVLDFVQDRPYVDFLTCFQMDQYIYQEDGTWKIYLTNLETAVASTARSILVPYHDPTSPPPDNIISIGTNCNCNGQ